MSVKMEFLQKKVLFTYRNPLETRFESKIITAEHLKLHGNQFLSFDTVNQLLETIDRTIATTVSDTFLTIDQIETNYNVDNLYKLNIPNREFAKFLNEKQLYDSLKENETIYNFIYLEIFKSKKFDLNEIKCAIKQVFLDFQHLMDLAEKNNNLDLSNGPVDAEFTDPSGNTSRRRICSEYLKKDKTFSLNIFASLIYRMSELSNKIPWIQSYFQSISMNRGVNFNLIDTHNNSLNEFGIDPFHVFRFIGILQGKVKYTKKDIFKSITTTDMAYTLDYVPPVENPFISILRQEINAKTNTNDNFLSAEEQADILTHITSNNPKFIQHMIENNKNYNSKPYMPFIVNVKYDDIEKPYLSQTDFRKFKKHIKEVLFFSELANREICNNSGVVAKIN